MNDLKLQAKSQNSLGILSKRCVDVVEHRDGSRREREFRERF